MHAYGECILRWSQRPQRKDRVHIVLERSRSERMVGLVADEDDM